MNDIVERLRRNPRGVAFELEHQCADEIESLRGMLRELRQAVHCADIGDWNLLDRIDAALAKEAG